MRTIDQQAWEQRLQYIESIKEKERFERIKTLKDMFDQYQVTSEEEEAFKMKADEIQVGGTHYKDMEVEPWDVMKSIMTHEEFVGFLKGNIIKYAMRQGRKDSNDAGKCKHYIQKLNEVLNGR